MLAIGKWLSIVVVGAWSGREEEDRIMVFFMVAVGSMMMVVSILEKRRLAAGEMGQRSCRVSFSFLGFFSFFFCIFGFLAHFSPLFSCSRCSLPFLFFFSFFAQAHHFLLSIFSTSMIFLRLFSFFSLCFTLFSLDIFFSFFFCLSIFFIIFLKASHEILRIMKWSKVLKTINQNGTEIHFLEFLYFFEKKFEENKGKKHFMTLINN